MKFSLCPMGAMVKDISAGLDLMSLKDPAQPEIFYDLLTSVQRQCEMFLFLGLILLCYTHKTLNPL